MDKAAFFTFTAVPLPFVYMMVSITSRLRETDVGQIDKYDRK